MTYDINEKQLEQLKLISSGMNGNISKELLLLTEYFFGELEPEKTKAKVDMNPKDSANKKLKEKTIGNFLKTDKIFEYLTLQNRYISKKIEKEREKAWIFLNNKDEATKAGFYSAKQSEQQLKKWIDKAYPKITEGEWEDEMNKFLLSLAIIKK